MSKLHEAAGLGQSIWLKGIDRPFIQDFQLRDLIEQGVYGATTHPRDLALALANGRTYDQQIVELEQQGDAVPDIAEKLLFTDVQTAVDLLHPIYERTHGVDGYVSLDVNPARAHSVDGLLSEGLRLAYDVDRVNVMVQIPATAAGIEAIEKLIGEGTNVNATHVYTLETYEKVAQAYLAGVAYFWSHLDIWRLPPASVVTLAVTQLDVAVDATLDAADPLRGRAGVATARAIYGRFQQIFQSSEWTHLAKHGSRWQRPLWDSSDDPRYVYNLMGPNTVHSLPPTHITTFLQESPMTNTLALAQDEAQRTLAALKKQGIDLPTVENQLQTKAIEEIRQGYKRIADNVLQRRDALAMTF